MGCTHSASGRTATDRAFKGVGEVRHQAPPPTQGRSHATSGNTADSITQQQQQLSSIVQDNSRGGKRASSLESTAAFTETTPSEPEVVRPHINWDLQFSEVTVESHIANGGYCTVLACQLYGERRAVKIPLVVCSDPEGAIADLNNEIEILKRLRHPHLCSVYGAGGTGGDTNDRPFLVLERLQDKNLSQQLGTDIDDTSMRAQIRIRKVRVKFPFRRRLELGLQLVELLRYLHCECLPNGFIVHRDLKPSNLGISEDGQLKVFDFGLARIREQRDPLTDKYVMTAQTGSQRFMAPEVFEGMPYNEKVDIFSYGIVLWELCSLQKPFAGMTAHQHARKVFKQGFRPVVDRCWPQGLGRLLQACWHPDPDFRPAATEAADTLSAIVDKMNSRKDRSAYDKL